MVARDLKDEAQVRIRQGAGAIRRFPSGRVAERADEPPCACRQIGDAKASSRCRRSTRTLPRRPGRERKGSPRLADLLPGEVGVDLRVDRVHQRLRLGREPGTVAVTPDVLDHGGAEARHRGRDPVGSRGNLGKQVQAEIAGEGTTFVSTSVIVTAAPGMTPPASSCTVPSAQDVRVCAAAGKPTVRRTPVVNAIVARPAARGVACRRYSLNHYVSHTRPPGTGRGALVSTAAAVPRRQTGPPRSGPTRRRAARGPLRTALRPCRPQPPVHVHADPRSCCTLTSSPSNDLVSRCRRQAAPTTRVSPQRQRHPRSPPSPGEVGAEPRTCRWTLRRLLSGSGSPRPRRASPPRVRGCMAFGPWPPAPPLAASGRLPLKVQKRTTRGSLGERGE